MQLKSLMNNYLNENNVQNLFNLTNKVMIPIEVKKNKWQTDEKNTFIKRIYEFNNIKQRDHFVLEIFKYQREIEADIEINIREKNVMITIHSYSPNVSELEITTSKDIDKIKKDVMYYYAE